MADRGTEARHSIAAAAAGPGSTVDSPGIQDIRCSDSSNSESGLAREPS